MISVGPVVRAGIVGGSMRSLPAGVYLLLIPLFHTSSGLAQTVPTMCSMRCPNGSMSEPVPCDGSVLPACQRRSAPVVPSYDPAAAAAAERKRNASAVDQEGLAAENSGDLEEAANKFMRAEDLDPENADIQAHLERVKAQLADQESTEVNRVLRQRIDDSIAAAHIRALRLELEKKLARRQALASVDPVSAECIFDGLPGCTEPVALVVVSAGMPPVPADAARFIESIPKSVRERPEVKSQINYYEHTSRIRGALQNKMIADKAAAKANPGDDKAKIRVVGDAGSLKAALVDEHYAKQPLVSMSIGLFGHSSASSGSAEGGGAKTGSNQ